MLGVSGDNVGMISIVYLCGSVSVLLLGYFFCYLFFVTFLFLFVYISQGTPYQGGFQEK